MSDTTTTDQRERIAHLNEVVYAVRGIHQSIVSIHDPDRLAQAICERLVQARGFKCAWILLCDPSGAPRSVAVAGNEMLRETLQQEIAAGRLLPCAAYALANDELFETAHGSEFCGSCPLAAMGGGKNVVAGKLSYKGRTFGALAVSLDAMFADDREERNIFSGIVADIAFALHNIETEIARGEAERRVREQKELLEAILQHAPVMVAMRGFDGKEFWANRAWETVTGFTLDEARRIDFFEALYPDEGRRRTALAQVERADGEWHELLMRTKEGKRVDAYWVVVPLSEGATLAIGLDVSDHKAAERKRKDLEATLRQAQKMEAIGRLAGGIAHDFNNLLTGIIGYTEMSSMALADEDPVQRDLGQIRRAANEAAQLTKQLLAFSRKQIIEPRVTSLNAVIAALGSVVTNLLGERIEYEFRPGDGLWRVVMDPGQIEQAVTNLVVNARNAMEGGGKLIIETYNAELSAEPGGVDGELMTGDYVVVAVTDSGAGMDEATTAAAFEPFFTTKDISKGAGLGLSTVYGIAKQNGGSVTAYSELGHGSTFKMYLPRARGADAAMAPATATRIGYVSGEETILVAEDRDQVRNLICRTLAEQGYRVLPATDGDHAVKVAAAHDGPIDLLLTDVVMPNETGPKLYATLAAMRPNLRVLFTSGYTAGTVVDHGVKKEEAFIEKPFRAEDLLRKIRAVLDQDAPTAE